MSNEPIPAYALASYRYIADHFAALVAADPSSNLLTPIITGNQHPTAMTPEIALTIIRVGHTQSEPAVPTSSEIRSFEPKTTMAENMPENVVALRNACAVKLAELGVQSATLFYSGGGDSGQLDLVSTTPDSIEIPDDVHSMLSDFGDEYMEESGVNWCDNEGGGGTLTFDLVAKTFNADVYWNETHSETGHCENDVALPIPQDVSTPNHIEGQSS